jgi:HD-GYP domain-containing protein (c-di-GMP phosphodiesterase class II)
MKTTTEIHEELVVAPQQTKSPPAPRAPRPRIQRPKAKLHFYAQTERLTTYTVALAQAMGLPAPCVSTLGAAAALHDIGKIRTPDRRPAGKTSRHRTAAEEAPRHPEMAAELIGNLHGFAACVPAIRYHHECYDGSGYPEGLKGNRIPLEARVLAVTDWFSEVTTDQANRPALSMKEATAQIKQNSGTRFDPAIVTTFVDVVNSGLAGASREDPARPRRRVNR